MQCHNGLCNRNMTIRQYNPSTDQFDAPITVDYYKLDYGGAASSANGGGDGSMQLLTTKVGVSAPYDQRNFMYFTRDNERDTCTSVTGFCTDSVQQKYHEFG